MELRHFRYFIAVAGKEEEGLACPATAEVEVEDELEYEYD
jgi:hypothetical protein